MTELTKTRVQLVNEALNKLLVVASGQSAEAEDQQTVDGKVDALIAQLSEDEICEIPDDEEIPSAWFDAVASLLANVCSVDFGIPYSLEAKKFWESELTRLTSTGPTYETLKAEYF